MLIGVVGKPNVGKSTFFSAATKAPAEIQNYPFTTIKPNRGVAYVRAKCPHVDFGLAACTPRTGTCVNGTRWVAVELLDVAGLVPGAHAGKGLGNQFLDDLRTADALIHVVDASGGTDAVGNPVPKGTQDPTADVAFLEDELAWWIGGIIGKGLGAAARKLEATHGKIEDELASRLTGLGVKEHDVKVALARSGVGPSMVKWTEEDLAAVGRAVREAAKPILIAANKADVAPAESIDKLRKAASYSVTPTSAQSELALRRAADHGLVEYEPGQGDFKVKPGAPLNAAQEKALGAIRDAVLKPLGSTGVQNVLEEAVYKTLHRIVVYPVEDETHLTDKEGRVLPDAHLVPKGTTARDLAYKVHTDLGEKFIRGIDARKKRAIGADHVLENGDVVRIVAAK